MELQKVTGPTKVVTDPVLLSALTKQGIDKDYVEFVQDYGTFIKGKRSPHAKFYRDLKSGRQIAVVSELPMVDADGARIVVGWNSLGGAEYTTKNNLFIGQVQGTVVELTVRNDQPDGRKAGNRLTFNPQLFLDGTEQLPNTPTLLAIDPTNPNYAQNVLEWDYGICKRRLRIIEGKLLGTWVFAQNPQGEVRIKYNQVGDFRLRLGQFRVDEDTEVLNVAQLDTLAKFQGGYPVTVGDSSEFNPDANPESTSVDGHTAGTLHDTNAGVSWATAIAEAGGSGNDTSVYTYPSYFLADGAGNTDEWRWLLRSILLFNTSALPDTAVISAAVLSIYGSTKADPSSNAPLSQVYSANPATNTAIVSADYTTLGSTAYTDSGVTYAAWLTGSPFWNDFVFNATGIAAIDKEGISKFGVRNADHDVAAQAPIWAAAAETSVRGYSSDQGAGYKPKLVVTYQTPIELTRAETLNFSSTPTGGYGLSLSETLNLSESVTELMNALLTLTASLTVALLKLTISHFPYRTTQDLSNARTVQSPSGMRTVQSTSNMRSN